MVGKVGHTVAACKAIVASMFVFKYSTTHQVQQEEQKKGSKKKRI